jgi:hypothetical protein
MTRRIVWHSTANHKTITTEDTEEHGGKTNGDGLNIFCPRLAGWKNADFCKDNQTPLTTKDTKEHEEEKNQTVFGFPLCSFVSFVV